MARTALASTDFEAGTGAVLGSNVSTVGGLQRAFEQARQWQCRAIQVYTTPSRRWDVPLRAADQLDQYFAEWARSPVRAVIAHVPFLVNVASESATTRGRSAKRLVEEIRSAEQCRIKDIVLHPGSAGKGDRANGRRRAAKTIRAAIEATAHSPVRILLENMAGQGGMLCADFEELAEMLAMIEASDRVGVCFDTAHAFMAGYPLTGYTGYDETVALLDEAIGCERIRVIHLNDSLTAHGSRHDRHAPVGEGQMGLAVFHALVRDERFADVPAILEVPDRDRKSFATLQLLRRLKAQEAPLTDLAPRKASIQLGLAPA